MTSARNRYPDRSSGHMKRAGRSVSLELHLTATTGREFVPYLRKHLAKAAGLMKTPVRELSIALVGDRRMSRLHEKFMGLPGPTDVLTFPIDEDARGRILSGEVVLCVPEARRQARRRGQAVAKELLLYALHGLLHLSGFDDRTEADYRRMHRTEDQILTRLGVGPVFQPPSRSGRRAHHGVD